MCEIDHHQQLANAVECLKSKVAVTLHHALTNVYKLDKSICAKHLVGTFSCKHLCSVSYHEKTERAKRASTAIRQRQR